MENQIKILFNGKAFNHIEDADLPDDHILVTQMMAEDIAAVLEPLRSEIEKEGGEVTVDLKGPTVFEISTKDLSEKLMTRVRKALTPPA
jgi:hypothetical protein